MFGFNIWEILGILAIICLLISFSIGKKAIWGALTLGILVCIAIGFASLFKGTQFFNWILFRKIAIISTLAGAFLELLGRLFNVSFKSKRQ